MQTLNEIRTLLAERGIRPKHRLGQNFLHDQNLIRKLVEAADPKPSEIVLEVGPGTGALTESLLETDVARVIASEIDEDMIAIIESYVCPKHPDRLRVVRGDCLASKRTLNAELVASLDQPFVLIANLPYQVSTPLLMTLLIQCVAQATPAPCRGLFFTVQREVAQRLASGPGGREFGLISVIAQTLCEVEEIATVPGSCFWPVPKVTSAMVAMRPLAAPSAILPTEIESFAAFCAGLFQKRRKQLQSILGRDVAWPDGVDPSSRPEVLSIEDLHALFRSVEAAQQRDNG